MFEKMFKRKPNKISTTPEVPSGMDLRPYVKGLDCRDVLELLGEFIDGDRKFGDVREIVIFIERLIDLRYFDYSISDDQRESLEPVIAHLIGTVEAVDNPEYVAAVQAAWGDQIDRGRRVGVGTVGAAFETLDYSDFLRVAIMQSRAAELVDFFDVYETTAKQHAPSIIRALLEDRLPSDWGGETPRKLHCQWRAGNAVLGLCWLLHNLDPTAEALLRGRDRAKFWSALSDYDQARQVLLELGLLKGRPLPMAVDLQERRQEIAGFLASHMVEKDDDFSAITLGDRAPKWDALPPDTRQGIYVYIYALRAYIFQETLKNLTSAEDAGAIMELALSPIKDDELRTSTLGLIDELYGLDKIAAKGDIDAGPDYQHKVGFDLLLTAHASEAFEDKTMTEAGNTERLNFVRMIFRDEWIIAANTVRYLLRYMASGKDAEHYEDVIALQPSD
jgi:hypothetical protein